MFIPSYSFIILDSGFYPLLPLHPGYPLPPLLHTASHHLPPHAASLAGQDFLWAPPTGSGLDADASTAANLPSVRTNVTKGFTITACYCRWEGKEVVVRQTLTKTRWLGQMGGRWGKLCVVAICDWGLYSMINLWRTA